MLSVKKLVLLFQNHPLLAKDASGGPGEGGGKTGQAPGGGEEGEGGGSKSLSQKGQYCLIVIFPNEAIIDGG